jgi:hypothetical protein
VKLDSDQRVRYNADGIRWRSPRKVGIGCHSSVDWAKRTGTVVRINYRGMVVVKWDATEYLDVNIPAKFLEKHND